MANHIYTPLYTPWKNRPAEFHPNRGWEVNGAPVKIKQKYYHYVWPKDGKNGSKWGRMKDIFTGKGPDIHCTVGANKMDYMFHRPRKNYWSLHTQLDARGPNCSILSPNDKINNLREKSDLKYDFYTRRFVKPYGGMWTDVKWQSKPWAKAKTPEAWRDVYGIWWQNPLYGPPGPIAGNNQT